jgi:hypothetical protein
MSGAVVESDLSAPSTVTDLRVGLLMAGDSFFLKQNY